MDRSPRTESAVEKALEASGVPLLRLEHLTGISRSTLRRKISNPLTLTLGEHQNIAEAIGADGTALYVEIVAPEGAGE